MTTTNPQVIELGFDFAIAGSIKQLQVGGWVNFSETLSSICSASPGSNLGPISSTEFGFNVFDISLEGSENRNIEIASVSFFDTSYNPISSTDFIGNTITTAALTNPSTSFAFSPDTPLNCYQLLGEDGSNQFVFLENGRFIIRIQIYVIDQTGTFPFFVEQELIIQNHT